MRLLLMVIATVASGCWSSTPVPATSAPAPASPSRIASPAELLRGARAGTSSLASAIDSRDGVIHLDYSKIAYVDDATAIEEHLCGEPARALARSIDEQLQMRAAQNDTAADVPRCAREPAGTVACRWGATGEGSALVRIDFIERMGAWRIVRVIARDAVGTESWEREQTELAEAALKRLAGKTCQ